MPVSHTIVPTRTAKQWAKRLRGAIKRQFSSLNFPLMSAQDCVAQQLGFAHWHDYEQQPQLAGAPKPEPKVRVMREKKHLTIPLSQVRRFDFIVETEPFAAETSGALNVLSSRPIQPDPGPAPLEKGDWIMDKDVQHPDLGRVKRCYFDSICKEWVVDLVLYDADGRRLGRTSPRGKGPSGFEPAVSITGWERIEKPEFPMTLDATGYRDWRGSATVMAFRNVTP